MSKYSENDQPHFLNLKSWLIVNFCYYIKRHKTYIMKNRFFEHNILTIFGVSIYSYYSF